MTHKDMVEALAKRICDALNDEQAIRLLMHRYAITDAHGNLINWQNDLDTLKISDTDYLSLVAAREQRRSDMLSDSTLEDDPILALWAKYCQ
jgi:hypothetical protein